MAGSQPAPAAARGRLLVAPLLILLAALFPSGFGFLILPPASRVVRLGRSIDWRSIDWDAQVDRMQGSTKWDAQRRQQEWTAPAPISSRPMMYVRMRVFRVSCV